MPIAADPNTGHVFWQPGAPPVAAEDGGDISPFALELQRRQAAAAGAAVVPVDVNPFQAELARRAAASGESYDPAAPEPAAPQTNPFQVELARRAALAGGANR